MPRKRLDPGTSEAPQVTAIVTPATRERITELAAERGVTLSTMTRMLLEIGLAALDAAGLAAAAA